MLNNELFNRNQYIRAHNELNKKVDTQIYIKGNRQKVELDKKLDELSIQNGVIVSSHLARQNLLNASASKISSIPHVVDTEILVDSKSQNQEDDNSVYVSPSYEKYINSNINKGKNIVDSLKNDDSIRGKIKERFNREDY